MIFTLIVRSHPLGQGSQSAFYFAQALYAKGHKIQSVFFYQDGVYHAQQYNLPADEPNIAKLWLNFAKTKDFQLNACITACEKRGITDDFIPIAGLGQLSSSMLVSERIIEF
ncbi:sulfurtransferase complex subunit TusD [Thiotrichales bacterium 19S3-7]|nr:sulfurtransferase complex subunit TusD [Thiotrichales bacterium 19S3-7]MCF6800863.1 sulfurtransferase complex subunit TusD [Thiotrichales bacterium 19S3-11]